MANIKAIWSPERPPNISPRNSKTPLIPPSSNAVFKPLNCIVYSSPCKKGTDAKRPVPLLDADGTRLVIGDFHLDAPRLCELLLGKGNGEHTATIVRPNTLGVECVWQRERAREASVAPLNPMVAF